MRRPHLQPVEFAGGPPDAGKPSNVILIGFTAAVIALSVTAVLAIALAIARRPEAPRTTERRGDLRLHLPSVADLVAGDNRVVFGFTDAGGKLLAGRDVTSVSVVVSEANAPSPPIESVSGVEFLDTGWRQVSRASYYASPHPLAEGFFKTALRFPRAGQFGIQVVVDRPRGGAFSQRLLPNVLSERLTPPVGAAAPRASGPTLREVDGRLSRIDSEPRLEDRAMHQTSLAEAIARRRPALVLFASPGLDDTRLSLPVLEVVQSLQPQYGEKVAFIHVEPYDLARSRRALLDGATPEGALRPSSAAEQWGVQNVPWLFVVDRDGRIHAKLFGPVARREVEGLLEQVLAQGR